MTRAATEYREKMLLLHLDRESAGGTLPEDVEAAKTAELDRLWGQMTPEEQEAAERPPEAKADLGLVDVVVRPGDRHLPRRPVA